MLAGCGSGSKQAAPAPRLPRALGERLAVQSEAVTRALEQGDDCSADVLAAKLHGDSIAAINAGRIPHALQEPLLSAVGELAGRIRCVATPAPKEKPKRKGKKHGKGKDD